MQQAGQRTAITDGFLQQRPAPRMDCRYEGGACARAGTSSTSDFFLSPTCGTKCALVVSKNSWVEPTPIIARPIHSAQVRRGLESVAHVPPTPPSPPLAQGAARLELKLAHDPGPLMSHPSGRPPARPPVRLSLANYLLGARVGFRGSERQPYLTSSSQQQPAPRL